jgi:hypothetical protein
VNKRERKAAEPMVERILDISQFPPAPNAQAIVWRSTLDYETLFECSEELGELMDSWLAAGCRLDRRPLRKQLEDDVNHRKITPYTVPYDREGIVRYQFSRPIREKIDLGLGGGFWESVRKSGVKPPCALSSARVVAA